MIRFRLHQLIEDERGKLSAARVCLWTSLALDLVTISVDIGLAIAQAKVFIPNTVYALEGTMTTAFAAWAAGPRIAQYLGPQVGAIASGIASAVRDARLPSKKDDERGEEIQ